MRLEPGGWAPEQTLAEARGSCRDSAWLLVAPLRELGLAARFVSGSLIQLVANVAPADGPAGPSADFTDLHAWSEVYLPGAGWIGLDATSGLTIGEEPFLRAVTPSPQSAAPISGGVAASEATFDVRMTVTRVRETPRTTPVLPRPDPGRASWPRARRAYEWMPETHFALRRAVKSIDRKLTGPNLKRHGPNNDQSE